MGVLTWEVGSPEITYELKSVIAASSRRGSLTIVLKPIPKNKSKDKLKKDKYIKRKYCFKAVQAFKSSRALICVQALRACKVVKAFKDGRSVEMCPKRINRLKRVHRQTR